MQKIESRLSIIFVAFLFSSLVYLVVGFALSRLGWKPLISDTSLHQILFAVAVVLSVSIFALILKLKSKQPETEKDTISKYVLLFALSEIPAILGLLLFFLTSKFLYLMLLCLASISTFFQVKPSDPE